MNLFPRKRITKTPSILQMEAVECGAAALAIILAHYGSYVPLEVLRVKCGVSRDGSKASNMVKAARTFDFTAKGFRMEPQDLRTMQLPAIIHWNFNHFVVLEGFHKGKVYLNDPAIGRRRVSEQELDESFTGVVLTFEPTADYRKQGKKPSLYKALAMRVRNARVALAFIFLVSLALVIPGLLLPAFTRIFVDYYLIERQADWVVPLVIGMLLTAGVRAALTWLQQRYLLRLEMKLSLTQSSQLYWHILRLPMAFFTQRSAGDVSARIGQNDRVAQLLSAELATTLLNIVLVCFFAILMLQYSVTLTLVGIGMAILNFVALRLVSRRRMDSNRRLVKSQGKLLSTTYSSLQQIETIKSSGSEDDAFERWAGYQAKLVNATQELGVTTQLLSAVPFLLTHVTTVIILIIGGYLVINGEMTVGMLVAFQTLMASFLAPVNELVNLGGQVQEIDGIIHRLNDVLNYEPEPHVELVSAFSAESPKLTGQVDIDNVTFGYSRLSPPLIEDFSLSIAPGMRVALVGGSGSGKSTIARLVAGMYTPWSGDILFDGKPREEIERAVLNDSLSMVDQALFLFEGTALENITMWDSSIPHANVLQAAKDAHIHDLISSRALGYEANVEEDGRNFSGGQRQRIEIARSLVTNPSILILDEATSALDPLTEQMIDDNLRRRGCTCLIIAHRLSTIRDCDEIIVLENGRVVERGTHEELWSKNGAYKRLIRRETPETELVMENIWESVVTA